MDSPGISPTKNVEEFAKCLKRLRSFLTLYYQGCESHYHKNFLVP